MGTQSSVFSTSSGGVYPWYSGSGFGQDLAGGHGTHTAGSAAGAALTDPAEAAVCVGTDTLGCLGECLNQTYLWALLGNDEADWDTWCARFDCDGSGSDGCLAGDVAGTLAGNGGMAQGARLAIFDTSFDGVSIWVSLVGNDLWEAADGTGCLVHSNSWGGYSYCTVDAECIMFDEYMHEVRLPARHVAGLSTGDVIRLRARGCSAGFDVSGCRGSGREARFDRLRRSSVLFAEAPALARGNDVVSVAVSMGWFLSMTAPGMGRDCWRRLQPQCLEEKKWIPVEVLSGGSRGESSSRYRVSRSLGNLAEMA